MTYLFRYWLLLNRSHSPPSPSTEITKLLKRPLLWLGRGGWGGSWPIWLSCPPLALGESTLRFSSYILSLNRKTKVIIAITIEIKQHPLKKELIWLVTYCWYPKTTFHHVYFVLSHSGVRRTAANRGIDMGHRNPVYEFAGDDPQVDDPVYMEIDVSKLRTSNDLPLDNNTDYFALKDVHQNDYERLEFTYSEAWKIRIRIVF